MVFLMGYSTLLYCFEVGFSWILLLWNLALFSFGDGWGFLVGQSINFLFLFFIGWSFWAVVVWGF